MKVESSNIALLPTKLDGRRTSHAGGALIIRLQPWASPANHRSIILFLSFWHKIASILLFYYVYYEISLYNLISRWIEVGVVVEHVVNALPHFWLTLILIRLVERVYCARAAGHAISVPCRC